MNKSIALTPPMGWNSWDAYGASVNEKEVLTNAEYMSANLKSFGYEYIVVDIQWYEPKAKSSYYNSFTELDMDEYSRLIPACNRFPSSKNGNGFKPLADYIHSLGLKFGIHIMRGIPRQAVHRNTNILGTNIKAREIALTNSICSWNTDMYGIDPAKKGSQNYYDSLFKLYSSWGVDFVKVDDICRSFIGDVPYFGGEVELIHNAIKHSGRDIVLSLSPGPALLEKAEHLKTYANMWRLTGDFWDRWEDLFNSFETCNKWSSHVGPGHWPDADMLPMGHIGIRSCEHNLGDRHTNFSKDEQITLLTLWCIFRSPLMLGCELSDLDSWTLSLLTNKEVLSVLNSSHSGHQLYRCGNSIAWTADDENGSHYLALFNTSAVSCSIETQLCKMGLTNGEFIARDLWLKKDLMKIKESISLTVPAHGARLIKLTTI